MMRTQTLLLLMTVGALALGRTGCNRTSSKAKDDGVLVKEVTYLGNDFTVAEVDLQRAAIRLFWKKADGQRYRTPDAVSSSLETSGQRLLFATNAGIFDPTFTPCGLHTEDGQELVPLNLTSGTGNFFLKPNGVFIIDDAGPRIIDATRYLGTSRTVRVATQSGPLLVIDGNINSQFSPQSTNKRIRSGVGLSAGNRVVFAISRQPVTFHDFALLFRDQLACRQALYLDGDISRFYVAGENHDGTQGDFAGILGVVPKGQ